VYSGLPTTWQCSGWPSTRVLVSSKCCQGLLPNPARQTALASAVNPARSWLSKSARYPLEMTTPACSNSSRSFGWVTLAP
jgi:hypothetical protein